MSNFNKTQLYIDRAAEREIVHRDYLAHCLRWTHILRYAKMGQNILDVGCGVNLPLAMMFYTNKFKPARYVGLDLRTKFEKGPSDFNFPVTIHGDFNVCDEKDWHNLAGTQPIQYDIVACLEVIEHMPKAEGIALLENLACFVPKSATIFLSTPCFNGKAAANHIYEWRYEELRDELAINFVIEAHYGTFASQREILPSMDHHEQTVFNALKKYYDSNILSILFAPNHPESSRNCIWRLRIR